MSGQDTTLPASPLTDEEFHELQVRAPAIGTTPKFKALLTRALAELRRHRSSPSSAWRGMAEMKSADRATKTFWLGRGALKELAYFSSGWGNWLNVYTDKQISFEPTHYFLLDLPPLPEPPK